MTLFEQRLLTLILALIFLSDEEQEEIALNRDWKEDRYYLYGEYDNVNF